MGATGIVELGREEIGMAGSLGVEQTWKLCPLRREEARGGLQPETLWR
jgi:hypothetical protein